MSPLLFLSPVKPRPAASRPRDAFTLVELLLGIIIAAIVGLTVYNVFWSGIKLDDRLRWVHENYVEMLIADQTLSKDLENAISLDLSDSYPDRPVFDGKEQGLSFLTATATGIKRVRYYSGLVDFGKTTKTLIGKRMDHAAAVTITHETSPVEFLLREEQDLTAWLTDVKPEPAQIVAAGLKKDTFKCGYAPASKDVLDQGIRAVDYKDQWAEEGLPMAVSCRFSVYDAKRPDTDILFKRDIFLAPIQTAT